MRILFSLSACILCAVSAAPASATSGAGCLQVGNLPKSEPLNLRAKPSARSNVVGRLFVGQHGIIAERGPCKPHNQVPSKQWCPVTVYQGDLIAKGWLKARYLKASECP